VATTPDPKKKKKKPVTETPGERVDRMKLKYGEFPEPSGSNAPDPDDNHYEEQERRETGTRDHPYFG
jgi:hypothetical protein